MSQRHILLLTGLPGVGKTTAVRRVVERLAPWRLSGFITEEIRGPSGRREGFRAVTFDDERRLIAHVDFPGPERVGKYGVDVRAIDELAAALTGGGEPDAWVIDEIGKMECLSQGFVTAMRGLFDAPAPVLATVARRGRGLIAEVRNRRDAELWELTRDNRERLPAADARWLAARRRH